MYLTSKQQKKAEKKRLKHERRLAAQGVPFLDLTDRGPMILFQKAE
jgi:hypothetical protein